MRIHSIICAFFLALGFENAKATTNYITREISLKAGEIWVKDDVLLPSSIWSSVPGLDVLFQARQNHVSERKLLDLVRLLQKNENLDVSSYKWRELDQKLGLEIESKLKISFEQPVKLQCLLSGAGRKYLIPVGGSQTEPYALVYAGSRLRFLWLPELDPPKDLQTEISNALDADMTAYNFFAFTNGVVLKTKLRSGSDEYNLFEAYPRSRPPETPDPRLIRQIQKSQNMSGSDWRRAFTGLKPGKGGYYPVEELYSTANEPHDKTP